MTEHSRRRAEEVARVQVEGERAARRVLPGVSFGPGAVLEDMAVTLQHSLLLLLAAALLAGCGWELRGEPAPVAAAPGLPVPAGAQEATVVRLVDGDTVILRGRGVGPLPAEPTKVRVLLVDTPEVHGEQECFGPEASDRAAELLPEGALVRVEADSDPEDRFGRALLHVWVDGVNVGEALVREGYASVLVVRPNERYLAAFERAETQARDADLGLWGACP